MDMNISEASLGSFIGETANDCSGWSVSGAGDVNADGFDDILIGIHKASGQTYLIFGKASGWSKDVSLSNADASFINEAGGDHSGFSVSGAGDVNGDGYDDILIGAYANAEGGGESAGQTYLILGKSSGWSMDTSLGSADASFIGEARLDKSGFSVSGAGDVNGDGFDDILIGAPGNDEGMDDGGQTYLILGKASGWSMDAALSDSDASFIGEAASDSSGRLVSGAGDVNGDGYDDILIGVIENDEGGDSAGQTYLILGKSSGWSMDTSLGSADASFIGEAADDWSGFSVSGAGDVNGDGYDDFLIGAGNNDEGGTGAGQTYLILGRSSGWSMDASLGSADASFIGEGRGDCSGSPVSGAGDVNGDGYDDILIEAGGNDEGGEYTGQTYLILGRSSGWSMDASLGSADGSFIGKSASEIGPKCFLSGAGDVNGDGSDDFLIGDNYNDEGGSDAGKTFLISGAGFSEPLEVYSVSVYGDPGYANEIDRIDTGESVFIELAGLDGNKTTEDHVRVNITTTSSIPLPIIFTLIETGTNTGVYRNEFRVPNYIDYLEDITITSWKNPTKYAVVQVHTPVKIRPLIDHLTMDEDEPLEVDLWNLGYNPITDWNIKTDADWIEWDEGEQILSGIPDDSDVGVCWVNISASDDHGHTDAMNFTIRVNNTPPSILTDNVVSILEDQEYHVDYNSDDEVGDGYSWSIYTDAEFLSFDTKTGVLNGTPGNDDVGEYEVYVEFTDNWGEENSTSFTLTVENTNDPPLLTAEPKLSIDEGIPYTLKFDCSEVDMGDRVEWSFHTNATWLQFNDDTKVLSGEPGDLDIGSFFINVSVWDLAGEMDFINYTLVVNNVNDPPRWVTVPPDAEIAEGHMFTYRIEAMEVDAGDEIEYGVETDPVSDLTIDPVSGLIEWNATTEGLIPAPGYVLKVDVTASDGLEEVVHSFSIEVIPNQKPFSTLVSPDIGVRVPSTGTVLEWTGTDKEKYPLTYDIYLHTQRQMVEDHSEDALFVCDRSSSSVECFDVESGNKYYWTVIPTDDLRCGFCSNDVYNFYVNTVPLIEDAGTLTANVGGRFKYQFVLVDPDPGELEDLELTIVDGVGDDMTIFDNRLDWTPTASDLGTHTIKVKVSDGLESSERNITIVVNEKIAEEKDGEKESKTGLYVAIGLTLLILMIGLVLVVFFVVRRGKKEGEEGAKEQEIGVEEPNSDQKEAEPSLSDVPLDFREAHAHDQDVRDYDYSHLYEEPAVPEEAQRSEQQPADGQQPPQLGSQQQPSDMTSIEQLQTQQEPPGPPTPTDETEHIVSNPENQAITHPSIPSSQPIENNPQVDTANHGEPLNPDQGIGNGGN